MSVQCRLILAGTIPVEDIAECAAPDPVERATPSGFGQVLSADLYERLGFGLSIRANPNGLYGAQDDDGSWWDWEPGEAVNLTFDFGDDRVEKGIPHML